MTAEAAWIAVDRAPGEVRAAAVDAAGGLIDLAIERPGGSTQVGDLHRGRVTARLPALAGAFVALVGGVDGFLPDSAGAAGVSEGMAIAVRIVRAAQGGKGPRLEVAPDVIAAGPPARLASGPGATARLAALHPQARLRDFWDEGLAEQVAALAEEEAALPDGGRMTITPTRALVAIDIDLGGGAAGRQGKTRAHEQANAAAITELARHIRLRNLAGAIVVDFAGLSARRRGALAPGLEAVLRGDPLRPRLLGFTALGLAEILRPRGHPPLHELLTGSHAAALAAGRALAREAKAAPSRRLRLRGSVGLLQAFAADTALQDDLRNILGEPARVQAAPALSGLRWELEVS